MTINGKWPAVIAVLLAANLIATVAMPLAWAEKPAAVGFTAYDAQALDHAEKDAAAAREWSSKALDMLGRINRIQSDSYVSLHQEMDNETGELRQVETSIATGVHCR